MAVRLWRWAAALLAAFAFLPGGALAADEDVRSELLKRMPEDSPLRFEVPFSVMWSWQRDASWPKASALPPEPFFFGAIEHRISETAKGVDFGTIVELRVLARKGAQVPILPAAVAWKSVTVNGRPATMRKDAGGKWLVLDATGPGEFRISASSSLPASAFPADGELAMPSARGVPTTVRFDSPAARLVRVSGSPIPIAGEEGQGTHGLVGTTVEGGVVRAVWEPLRPIADRAPLLSARSLVAWRIRDAAHEVRARVDLEIAGGPAAAIRLDLPEGFDRLEVTGPDVRSHRAGASGAEVFLRGAILGRTRIGISCEVPRATRTGKVSMPSFGVSGASMRGGILAVAHQGEGVLLESDGAPGEPMALFDLPDDAKMLSAGTPAFARAFGSGGIRGEAEIVRMDELAVRETIIDEARVETFLAPFGGLVQKVVYEMRNGVRPFLGIFLPEGAILLEARVSDLPVRLARGEGGRILVPLAKSTQTIEGLVSFPVEIVWAMKTPPLSRKGTLAIPLARADVPAAYATSETYLPEGFAPRSWAGGLSPVDRYARETATVSLDYARAYRDPDWKADEKPSIDPKAAARELARNYWLLGDEAYRAGDIAEARRNLDRAASLEVDSPDVRNAKRLLSNIEVATGRRSVKEREQRALAEQAKTEIRQKSEGLANRQREALSRAGQAAAAGRSAEAAAALEEAETATRELARRGALGEREKNAALESISEQRKPIERERETVAALQKQREELAEQVILKARKAGAVADKPRTYAEPPPGALDGVSLDEPRLPARTENVFEEELGRNLARSGGRSIVSGLNTPPKPKVRTRPAPREDLLGSYFGVLSPVSPAPPSASPIAASSSIDAGFISNRGPVKPEIRARTENAPDAARTESAQEEKARLQAEIYALQQAGESPEQAARIYYSIGAKSARLAGEREKAAGGATKPGLPPADSGMSEQSRKIFEEVTAETRRADARTEFIAQHYFQVGKQAYDSFDYVTARENLEKCLQLNPKHGEARRFLERSRANLGERHDETRLTAEQVAGEEQARNQAVVVEIENILVVGRRHYEKEEYKLAIEQFRRVKDRLRIVPWEMSVEGYRRQADQLIDDSIRLQSEKKARIEREQYPAAIRIAQREQEIEVRRLDPRIWDLATEARKAYGLKQYEKAEALSDDILKLDPYNSDASRMRDMAIEARHERDRLNVSLVDREEFEKEMEEKPAIPDVQMRFYDIRDVAQVPAVQFPGPAITMPVFGGADAEAGLSGGTGLGFDLGPEAGGDMFSGENLAQYIRDNIAAGRWGPGTSIAFRDGNLIINQEPDVQRQVVEYLNALRERVVRRVGLRTTVLPLSGEEAAAAGIVWKETDDALRFAVCDRAQAVTLRAMAQALGTPEGLSPPALETEAIVGVDASLPEGTEIRIQGASERALDILCQEQRIILPAGFVLLIADRAITMVQGGPPARHGETLAWPEPIVLPARFALPRTGRVFRFEKLLWNPEDVHEIRCDYRWKGGEE